MGTLRRWLAREHVEKMAESRGQDKELETFKKLIEVAEREGPERCNTQLGEGVGMATKVVKSFKEKVINIVKWRQRISIGSTQEFPCWTSGLADLYWT